MPAISPQEWLAEKEFREETLPEMKALLEKLEAYLKKSPRG